ncbi:MAG: pilus assembly protein PilP [Deltaproteobacteria bacterium]|nr:pilus assembly protein PilP [Deltaproteobacteria bacterium]
MKAPVVSMGLAACLVLGPPPASAQSPKTEMKEKATKVEAPPPQEHSYLAAGKRDPFKNEQEVVLTPPPPGCNTLCDYEVDQLRVAALVSGLSVPLAGLEAPNGKVYIVDKGTRLGKRGGRVVEVSGGKIVVEEPCAKDSTKKCRSEIAIAKEAKPHQDEDLTRRAK